MEFVITGVMEFNKYFANLYETDPLKKELRAVFEMLKNNPLSGTKIPHDLWPKTYKKKYKITNLWKYDLSGSWRLVYTFTTEVDFKSIGMLEVFSHKEYAKRFGY